MWCFGRALVAPIVGTFLAVLPVYLLVVRQTMSAKDASIDALREQNKSLERERLPLVIQEKRILQEDIELRAREKVEAEKVMQQISEGINRVTRDVKDYSENSHRTVEHISGQVKEIGERIKAKTRDDQTVGLLMGAKMLQESYIQWRSVFVRVSNLPEAGEFDRFLFAKCISIFGIVKRVRCSEDFIKIEELVPDPEFGQKVAEIGMMAGTLKSK